MKEKILHESTGLFVRFGIRSVTMDDISKHMSISKKTIYQYFKDKEDLVFQCTEAYFKNEAEEIKTIERKSKNAIEYIFHITVCLREDMKDMNQGALYDLQKYYPSAYEIYKKFKGKLVLQSVTKFLEQGKKEGVFRETINSEIMARLRMEEIEMSFNPEKFPSCPNSMIEIHNQLFEHFIYGLLTPKGFEALNRINSSETINN